MALKPSARYPGQIDTSDPVGYPHGKARNRALPGDGTGTPWERDVVNDLFGFQQALLVYAGITPSEVPDTAAVSQYLAALDSMIPKAVDNYGYERYQQRAGILSAGHMFSIGETMLGFPQQSGMGGGDGPFIYSDFDYRTGAWSSSGSASIGQWSHPAYGNGYVVTFETDGGADVRKWEPSTATWSGAGTMAGVSADNVLTVRHNYFATAGLWITVIEQGGEHAFYTDDDLSGAWTYTAPPSETLSTTGAAVRDMVSNENVCLVAHQSGFIDRTADGATWAAVELPSFTGDIVGLAYNERTEVWAVAGTGGKTWFSSDDGETWDAGPTYAWTATAGTRIAALGRHWVLAGDSYLWRFNEVSSKLVRETLQFSTDIGVHDVMRHNDQIVITHIHTTFPAHLIYKLSHRLVRD